VGEGEDDLRKADAIVKAEQVRRSKGEDMREPQLREAKNLYESAFAKYDQFEDQFKVNLTTIDKKQYPGKLLSDPEADPITIEVPLGPNKGTHEIPQAEIEKVEDFGGLIQALEKKRPELNRMLGLVNLELNNFDMERLREKMKNNPRPPQPEPQPDGEPDAAPETEPEP
jgi:hypothetical protein